MEYIEFIQNKDKNRIKIREIENSISRLNSIKNIAKSHSKYFSKLNVIRQQVEGYLKNDSSNAIFELENKLKTFTQNIPDLESKVFELEQISNFPTVELENEIKNHIHFCYNGMDIDKINFAFEKCKTLMSKLNSERIRIQKDKDAKKLEEERLERERLERIERERKQKIENERREKERLERIERERIEQERLAQIERERLQRERLAEEERLRKERNIKIAKYVGIAIAIGLGIWLILAVVVPFIMQWWWAILLIAIIIGYFISKK